LVLHDDRLPEAFAHARPDEPRDDVDRAARRERHQHPDRFGRIGLRHNQTGSERQPDPDEKAFHLQPHLMASGLVGEPTAPVIGIAGATNMNSYTPSSAQSFARSAT